jgi:hypothetical protein
MINIEEKILARNVLSEWQISLHQGIFVLLKQEILWVGN